VKAPAHELRHNCVSLLENFAQTLGVLSPVGTISVIVPLLIASAGNGTWLLLLITLSTFLIVMAAVLRFASLHSSAGSLAAFARLGLGPWAGLTGGWIYVLGMLYCVPSAILASASYFDLLLTPRFGSALSPGHRVLLTGPHSVSADCRHGRCARVGGSCTDPSVRRTFFRYAGRPGPGIHADGRV
jgi:amino acid transporter